MIKSKLWLGVMSLLWVAGQADALPVLRESAGDFGAGGFVTIYPDHRDSNLFYFMPNKMDFTKGPDGTPTFGMTTYGVETGDPKKAYGFATFTLRPLLSEDVDQQLKLFLKKNPNARLAPLPVGESYMTIGTARDGTPSEAGKKLFESWDLPFRGGVLETEVGGNVYLSGLGAILMTNAIKNPSMVQLNSCYTVDGVTPFMDATVTVDYKRVFDHTKKKFGVGWGWFGASISKEVQKLVETGAMTIELHGDTKFEEVVMEMARQIAADYMKPDLSLGTADVSDSGKVPFKHMRFGWGSVHIEERHHATLNIRKQANITDIRCIAAPFRGLTPYAARIIQNSPYVAGGGQHE